MDKENPKAPPPAPPGVSRVEMIPPPASILSTINKQIDAAVAAIPSDRNGLLILDVKTKVGDKISANVVFVQKFDHDWDLLAYVGKTWGEPIEAGVSVRKTF